MLDSIDDLDFERDLEEFRQKPQMSSVSNYPQRTYSNTIISGDRHQETHTVQDYKENEEELSGKQQISLSDIDVLSEIKVKFDDKRVLSYETIV